MPALVKKFSIQQEEEINERGKRKEILVKIETTKLG
jgi:hypothetical protein